MDCLSSGFADVDRARDPSFFSSCLATLNSLPYFQKNKTKSFALMDVGEGSRVLDVGCGLGYDALALAEMVGQKGRVVAADFSRIMLQAARSQADGLALPL